MVIYTAADLKYATAMCKLLDPSDRYIKKILTREHCFKTEKGYMVKDLRMVASTTGKVVLVDNSPQCFAPQINNGIPILTYISGNDDTELLKLFNFLVYLKEQPSMPEYLRKYFNLGRLIRCCYDAEILEHLKTIGSNC